MSESTNMNGAVRFDLAGGTVRLNSRENCVLIPSQALASLFRELPTHVMVDLGRTVGHHIARVLEDELPDLEELPPAKVVEHLGRHLALVGLGSLAMERWGAALVFTVENSTVLIGSETGARVDPGDVFLGAVVEGVLARLSGEARVVALSREDGVVRLLACNETARQLVLRWVGEGRHYGEILARLNTTRGAA